MEYYWLFRDRNGWKTGSVVDGERSSGLECLMKKGSQSLVME